MKARYPVEAYALAMVIFSQNMRIALITGILILFISTLGLVIDGLVKCNLPKWSRNSSIIILMVSLTFSLFQIVLVAVLGYKINDTASIFHIFLGILIAKHIINKADEIDYNSLLLEGAGAFAMLLIISLIREFMAEGSIYGYKILDFNLKSYGFSQVIMGFLLTGLGLALLNRIFYHKEKEKIKTDSIFVILPVVLLEQPFTIDGIDPSVSMLIIIIIVLILLYSIRKHLVFSRLSKGIKNLPAELVSAGMVYMILSMF
ncbi:hypothetical protein [Herbinix luporum]|jgi:hypothetical protein|uniref:Uncharacterized protein n=1 Tax=Herbinix luporum TaxID=1679721 RepID=A0A0K8J512_9FIRM|nr:hypothetical protein [Herbinix luporum]MDI9488409.1 hypothetical protein [Bacillota bacterium]CUH92562.1 hypothetical protein SD1D_1015 [Herbinix luporum]HHT56799.1 hypothetical protein [Herbinix luporum]